MEGDSQVTVKTCHRVDQPATTTQPLTRFTTLMQLMWTYLEMREAVINCKEGPVFRSWTNLISSCACNKNKDHNSSQGERQLRRVRASALLGAGTEGLRKAATAAPPHSPTPQQRWAQHMHAATCRRLPRSI